MQIGKLRDLVEIQQFVLSEVDEYGQQIGTWRRLANVWADVKPTGGGEVLITEGPKAHAGYTVKMRYRSDVTSANRIIWRGAVLSISAVMDPDQRRRELKLLCSNSGEAS